MGEGIHVFGQNCIRIETAAGVVYTDPFRMTEEPHDADFVLITHDPSVSKQADRAIHILDGRVSEVAL